MSAIGDPGLAAAAPASSVAPAQDAAPAPQAPAAPSRFSAPAPALTVLVGFADALAAPEAVWSLSDGGARVVAFARRGSRPAIRHARGVSIVEITAPEADADAAIADLRAALSARGVVAGALMPLDDAAVWLCDALASAAPAGVTVAGPTGPQATLALDKRVQLDAARAAGFAVPLTTVVRTRADLDGLPQLPLALKPALAARRDGGRLRRGSGWVCGTAAELTAAVGAWDESEPLLAQPLIAGAGEGLFGIADADGVWALSAHRRLRMMNPAGSGSSACQSIAVDPALAVAAERMLDAAGWRGLFMLEFLRDADGTPWFMELNGRTWGSLALARGQGLEYPAWSLRAFGLGDGPTVPRRSIAPVLADGLVCRHLGRELVHLAMVIRGPRSVALTGWPSRRRALGDVLRVRAGERWYNWRPGERRVFLADAGQTLRAVLRRS